MPVPPIWPSRTRKSVIPTCSPAPQSDGHGGGTGKPERGIARVDAVDNIAVTVDSGQMQATATWET